MFPFLRASRKFGSGAHITLEGAHSLRTSIVGSQGSQLRGKVDTQVQTKDTSAGMTKTRTLLSQRAKTELRYWLPLKVRPISRSCTADLPRLKQSSGHSHMPPETLHVGVKNWRSGLTSKVTDTSIEIAST